MTRPYGRFAIWSILICWAITGSSRADVVKEVINANTKGSNLVTVEGWKPFHKGFEQQGDSFLCDNNNKSTEIRGAAQVIQLNQKTPHPIVAVVWSKAENVGGSSDSDYSFYLDLEYADGEMLYGQTAPFRTNSHDWERGEVVIIPAKAVKRIYAYLMFRNHSGKAWFRFPEIKQIAVSRGAALFDGVPVLVHKREPGFQLRDVSANSDFLDFSNKRPFGVELSSEETRKGDVVFIEGELRDTTNKDRALTLVYTVPVDGEGWNWLTDPRREERTRAPKEYLDTSSFEAGANGKLSRYPLAAIASDSKGQAIAIDMGAPAFFRVGYNAGTRELFIAYDVALTAEKNSAKFRFCIYPFDPHHRFRAALAKFYQQFPDYFQRRVKKQGLWMPFFPISKVQGWQDFGFAFKEGDGETKWDDAHDIATFRYTEPNLWWMKMPTGMPRTMDAALAEAKRLAEAGDSHAKALFTSVCHDEQGLFSVEFLNRPWSDGAVWGVNSSPGLSGSPTDFDLKWNADVREKFYGEKRRGDLDGEYIDSSEGYVSDALNFRRDHFASARTPLTYSLKTRKPAVFRGLAAYAYTREMAKDVHARGKLMMANSTPSRLCWLSPWLDVMGTETNWNRKKIWQPMSDSDLLYRRAMSGSKPYCFLMNTVFDDLSNDLIVKYMKRCLAYGMFPGFFSADASGGHYFSRPDLYNRDRSLFKKYVPLCRRISEAGWEPVTNAGSDNSKIYLERFGNDYLTVFNDSSDPETATITIHHRDSPPSSRDLVSGKTIIWTKNEQNDSGGFQTSFTLDGEDVALIELK